MPDSHEQGSGSAAQGVESVYQGANRGGSVHGFDLCHCDFDCITILTIVRTLIYGRKRREDKPWPHSARTPADKRRHEAADGFGQVLKVTTRDLGNQVEIRVRDNGTGIAPEFREKLFQPFFTTKPTGEGTGLGLSISWDIVTQQHGGTIAVDSRVGEFTEFTVRLPRVRG
jgi:hypothetical protein